MAANFADGVDKAQKVADEIKAAFDAGTPHDADGAMHTGLELLPALPGMAAGEGKLDSDALATVKSACKSAVEQLLILHEGFHPHPGDEGDAHTHDNASVLEALDKAVADLKSATGGVTE